MDWKEFIASIIDTVAWPSVIVVAIFVFKAEPKRVSP